MHPRPTARLGLTPILAPSSLIGTLMRGGVRNRAVAGPTRPTLSVVATTTVFADIVRNVGGERVTVTSIIPAGVGPEDYEPKPDDAKKLAGAELIVSNGVGLDDFLDKLVTAAGEGGAPRLVLGDGIPTIDVDGEPNPHFWLDPSLVASHYVPAIAAALTKLDPAGAATYAANAAAYATQLERARRREQGQGRRRSRSRTASSSRSTTRSRTSRPTTASS